jgi:hypothetical protein
MSERRAASEHRSLVGAPSRVFARRVGQTVDAAALDMADLLIDRTRFDSEGNWAFCRFTSDEVPAVRMGFQSGSFEIGATASRYDPERLQVHLEVLTAEGAFLWIPTGTMPASALAMDAERLDIRLEHEGRELFAIEGWPSMRWSFRTPDDALEVDLRVDVRSVTILPDAVLPHAVFGMWETVGRAHGTVRVAERETTVEGDVFFDHTRVVHRPHPVTPRRMYLYSTMALQDVGRCFGYHAEGDDGLPIDDYCFGVDVDAGGSAEFLPLARLHDLQFDDDGLPARWRVEWRGPTRTVEADVTVRPIPLARSWGGASAPRSRAAFTSFPLVLDIEARVERDGVVRRASGGGLAEYYAAESPTS